MIEKKVEMLLKKLPEVEHKLGEPDVVSDQKRYRSLTQEHAYLSELQTVWHELVKARKHLEENQALLKTENDPDFAHILEEDIKHLSEKIEKLEFQIQELVVPPDPNDNRNVIMELRAGTGGEEAALFVADCARMYRMYADHRGWRYELLSCTASDLGGYKEYIMVISGHNVHRLMKYEGGTHRVQRVPDTEAQGRIHTSAVTIAILLEPEEDSEVVVEEKDLRVDTYRSSGAGGQHVNTTDSAVRLTHLPTGIVVYCQEERSQHKNKEKAMRFLKAKIAEEERRKREAAVASSRAQQVGSGDRSERIRTYNFPQNRVTDHRINLTLYKLDRVMEGDLDEITSALVTHYHQQTLAT